MQKVENVEKLYLMIQMIKSRKVVMFMNFMEIKKNMEKLVNI